jgi:outer membrane protein OmpA-like peptidoglycan-associated protein
MVKILAKTVRVLAFFSAIGLAGLCYQADANTPTVTARCNNGPFIVFFDLGETKLIEWNSESLNDAVASFKNCPGAEILIAGHTDLSTEEERDPELSLKRTDIVSTFLIAKGISKSDIAKIAFGSSRPSVPTNKGEALIQNRRVEIMFRRKP